jgi:hypothetical protein
MPNLDDLYNAIVAVRGNTQPLHNDLQFIHNEIQKSNLHFQTMTDILNAGFLNLSKGIIALAKLQQFNNNQNSTIICILEKISEHTCHLVNESHKQSDLQTSITDKITDLLALYEASHADQAIEYNRLKEIKKELEQCCPNIIPEPPCQYTPCEREGKFPIIEVDTYKPINSETPR